MRFPQSTEHSFQITPPSQISLPNAMTVATVVWADSGYLVPRNEHPSEPFSPDTVHSLQNHMSDLESEMQNSIPQSRMTEDCEVMKMEVQRCYKAWPQPEKFVPHCHALRVNGPSRLLQCIYWFVPSFLQSRSSSDPKVVYKSHPSAFLDGMRGLAAFAVFLCHLSYGTWDIVHSYGSGPGENWRLIQLPIVRLFYSGPPMVAIFFVVSGYALSYKPIQLIRSRQREALLTTISSSTFRRALRLYLPCFVSTFITLCLVQLGLYDLTAKFADNLRAVKEPHMRSTETFMQQFCLWAVDMFNFVNVFDWSLFSGTTRFDPHLWTIPVEYRCSLLLFLTHVLTARMSSKLRILTILSLLGWGLRWDRWDMTPFWCGQILAEVHHAKLAKQSILFVQQDRGCSKAGSKGLSVPQTVYLVVFLIGCYLASFPDCDAHLAPGFIRLNALIPSYWSQKHRFWPNIGAALIVWSGENVHFLRHSFLSAPVQYLGQISFPLYVVHGPIINTFAYLVMDKMYTVSDITVRWKLEVIFFFAALLTVVLTVWVADVFWRLVDIPCVKLSRWIEDKCLET